MNSASTEARSPAERQDLSKRLLLIAAVRLGVVTLALGAVLLKTNLESLSSDAQLSDWQYILIGLTYALSIGYAGLLRYQRLHLPLAYAQVFLDASLVSVLVLMTGGIESVFSFTYVFTVLTASTTLYRRGATVAVAGGILMYGTILAVQLGNLLPQVLPVVREGTALFSFVIHTLGMGLVAGLASTLAEKARITGQQLATKSIALERLEELHGAILRSLPAGLMTLDAEGTVRYANDAALVILRLDTENVVGRSLTEVVPVIADARDRKSLRIQERRERFEETHARADGSTIRLGFSFAPLTSGPGQGSTWMVVFQDVTEIVLLKEAVERAERLATVGKFAAGLAHEVRNPLASMCASIDVLKGALRPPEPLERLMNNVVREAERLNHLISDFLVFARPRSLQLQVADLSPLAQSVAELFVQDARIKGIVLEVRAPQPAFAAIDEDLLRQVLWNLLKNGADAMPQGGKLILEVGHTRNGEPCFTVKDEGIGIPPELSKRVFDPFYTTKERGTGLGLAITHAVVEAHGGSIIVESRVGVGTEMKVILQPNLPPAGETRASTDDIDLMGPP